MENKDKKDAFVIPPLDEGNLEEISVVGKSAATALNEFNDNSDRKDSDELEEIFAPSFVEDLKPSEGLDESSDKLGDSKKLRNIVLIFWGLILFGGFVLGMILLTKNSNSKSVEISANNNTNTLNQKNLDDESKALIEKIKNEANSNVNAIGNVYANNTPQNANLNNANLANQPSMLGTPIIDIRQTPELKENREFESPNVSKENKEKRNIQEPPVQTENKTLPNVAATPISTPTPTNLLINEENYKIYRAGITEGRNEQVSLSFATPTSSSKSIIVNNNVISQIPTFGTTLPIRFIGAVHTLQTGSLVRMELTQVVEGKGWRLQRGTIFVGKVQGGQNNRIFVSLLGFIDKSGSLTAIGGDVLGKDGAIGLIGEKKKLASRWRKILEQVLDKATTLGSAYLLGRKGNSGSLNNNSFSPEEIVREQTSEIPYYVFATAGSRGYILINDLNLNTSKSNSVTENLLPNNNLNDEETIKLLSEGNPQEIKKLFPKLNPQWQDFAKQYLQ